MVLYFAKYSLGGLWPIPEGTWECDDGSIFYGHGNETFDSTRYELPYAQAIAWFVAGRIHDLRHGIDVAAFYGSM